MYLALRNIMKDHSCINDKSINFADTFSVFLSSYRNSRESLIVIAKEVEKV